MGKPINIKYMDDYVEFSLSNSKDPAKEKLRIKIDREHFNDLVAGTSSWYIHKNKHHNTCYVRMNSHNKHLHLHREVMRTKKHLVTDHINRNGLDNRKANLRECTQRDNLTNCTYRNRTLQNVYYKGYAVTKVKTRSRYKSKTYVYDIYQVYKNKKYICAGKSLDIVKQKLEKRIKNEQEKRSHETRNKSTSRNGH